MLTLNHIISCWQINLKVMLYLSSQSFSQLFVCMKHYTAHFFNNCQQQNCWHTDTKWSIAWKTKQCRPFPSPTHRTIVSLYCELFCYFLLVDWAAAQHFVRFGRKGRLAFFVWSICSSQTLVCRAVNPPTSSNIENWQGGDNRWCHNAQNMMLFVQKQHAKKALLKL